MDGGGRAIGKSRISHAMVLECVTVMCVYVMKVYGFVSGLGIWDVIVVVVGCGRCLGGFVG